MNKKFVTIAFIIFGLLAAAIVVMGIIGKDATGKSGWRSIVDSWRGKEFATEIVCNSQTATLPACRTTALKQTGNSTGANSGSQNNSSSQSNGSTGSTSSAGSTSSSSSSGSNQPSSGTTLPTPTPTPVPTPKPTPTPTPTPPPPPPTTTCQAGGACTSAEVASHTSQSSCWVIYGAKVYEVTSYIPKHKGGSSVFTTAVCGHDITSYLNGSASSAGKKHTHSSAAYSLLNTYWYANLK